MPSARCLSPVETGEEIIVDFFCGGGGASQAVSLAIRDPDIAINHDPEAIALHEANCPNTRHYIESVYDVDPLAATGGRPVGLAWFSPDCRFHSRAKGGKPVKKNIRGLAWVAIRWAMNPKTKPRIIFLENVPEFMDWGPLGTDGRPCKDRTGLAFTRWKSRLESLGYVIEQKLLVGADFGSPTIRERLFLVARCDGRPISWPEPSRSEPNSLSAARDKRRSRKTGQPPKPAWRGAHECMDWSVPTSSIFDRKRPLVANSLKRIAKGTQRFVIDTDDPYLIPRSEMPSRLDSAYASMSADERLARAARVAAFMEQASTGMIGRKKAQPLSTIVGHGRTKRPITVGLTPSQTLNKVIGHKNNAYLVAALLAPYYGSGSGTTGRDIRLPSPTITTKDRLQVITVMIDAHTYAVFDICMRMLQPLEAYRCQGFPQDFKVQIQFNGKPLSKHAQMRMCGNSVCPDVAAALIDTNLEPERGYLKLGTAA